MAKIGIFGGSFNPPHLGHILAVREFREKLALDRVVLIPASVPPHKRLAENSPTPLQRLEMTKLAVGALPYAEVLDLELTRQGASYTADTVELLRQRYPSEELYLLMGTDMFLSFDRWYCPEHIAREVTLAVAHRSEDDADELNACAQRLAEQLGARIAWVRNDYLPYSSTSVRAMLAFGAAKPYLTPEVLNYILKNRLYYTGKSLHDLPFEKLREISLSLHRPQRVAHVRGCSETAERLARLYGANPDAARRAGILHDITKALTPSEQLQLCENYGMILNRFERENPKLLHAKTGAEVARRVFGESDEVYQAVFWHTTGKADMTTLEKIVYLADYMEPNRDFEGVQELRRLADTDLDKGVLLGLEMSMEQLLARGREIDPNSLAALRFLKERKSMP